MITPAFTKLQRSILTSSIWLHDMPTRLVWITLLALCDRDAIARCSPAGLAHMARVKPAECAAALETLIAPDSDSRDMSDGRRIERVPGGYLLLGYPRVLAEGIDEEKRTQWRERQAEHRAKKRANGETIRPEHRDDRGAPKKPRKPRKPKIIPTGFTPARIAPAEEDHSKSYDQYQAESDSSEERRRASGEDSFA